MPSPAKHPPALAGNGQRKLLLGLLACGCLVQFGVLAYRLSGRMAQETPAEPPPVPVVRPNARPTAERGGFAVLRPENRPSPTPAAVRLAEDTATPSPAPTESSRTGLPPELTPAPSFVAQIRQARAAGADLWLLAHVSDTQFQRQLAALRRNAVDGLSSLEPNQARQQFLEATAGADAARRLQVAEWARHRYELRDGTISTTQAESLFELETAFAERLRELQRAAAARELDMATYGQRQTELRRQLHHDRERILGKTGEDSAAGTASGIEAKP